MPLSRATLSVTNEVTYIESHPALQLRRLSESGLRSTRKEIVRKLSRVSFIGALSIHVEKERDYFLFPQLITDLHIVGPSLKGQ